MLAKLFSRFGPGFPKVDLVLSKKEYTPGEKVMGSFHLHGGLRQVKIHRLECDLIKKSPGQKPRFIQPVTTVLMNRELDSKAEAEYPFHFLLPKGLEEDGDESSYHLQTKLVLKNDVETTDTDEIHIRLSSI